jgi:hypothetical protein
MEVEEFKKLSMEVEGKKTKIHTISLTVDDFNEFQEIKRKYPFITWKHVINLGIKEIKRILSENEKDNQ